MAAAAARWHRPDPPECLEAAQGRTVAVLGPRLALGRSAARVDQEVVENRWPYGSSTRTPQGRPRVPRASAPGQRAPAPRRQLIAMIRRNHIRPDEQYRGRIRYRDGRPRRPIPLPGRPPRPEPGEPCGAELVHPIRHGPRSGEGTPVYAAFDAHITRFQQHNPAADSGTVYGANIFVRAANDGMGAFYTHITDTPTELGLGSTVARGDLLGGSRFGRRDPTSSARCPGRDRRWSAGRPVSRRGPLLVLPGP